MSTTTTTLGLTKPALSAGDVWGDDINDNFDTIDTFAADTNTALSDKAALSHTHVASAVTDFSEAVDDRVNTLLTAGSNITLDYNDSVNTLTINASGGGGGATEYDTATDFGAATISADIQAVRTSGYTTLGDGGHGLYVRLAAAPSSPTNNAYIRSVDRYTLSGSTDATHGGYWVLVPEGDEVRIEQFGGKADTTTGLDGTDNLAPLTDACNFIALVVNTERNFSHTIKFGVGKYRFSDTIHLHRTVKIEGQSSGIPTGSSGTATQWYFPDDTTGFVFHADITGPGEDENLGVNLGNSLGAHLHGVSFFMGGTSTAKRGVLMRAQATVSNCSFFNVPGTAILVRANALAVDERYGNANNWKVRDCYASEFNLHGLHVTGADANGGLCDGFITHGTAGECGCGILEENAIGANTFRGLQITGYGNSGVHYAGNHYQFIGDAGTGHTTTPGTDNNVWYLLRAGIVIADRFEEWSGAGTYIWQTAIMCRSCPSVYVGAYVESNTTFSHVIGGGLSIGGNGGYTSMSAFASASQSNTASALLSNNGFRTEHAFTSGSTKYTANGDSFISSWGAPNNRTALADTYTMFTHRRGIDAGGGGLAAEFGYGNSDVCEITWGVPFEQPWLGATTESTAQTMGRSAAQPFYINFFDFALRDRTDRANARIMGLRNAAPSSGNQAKGEIYFTYNPDTYGAAAWVATASGTPGTFGTIPVFGLTSATPQRNGDLVVECTNNTTVTLKYKGSDGTVRSGTITLS
jgi:hypothetical protein